MSENAWTRHDFIELAGACFAAAHLNAENFAQQMQAYFEEAIQYYDSATDDGKLYLDTIVAKMTDMFDAGLQQAPDTADTRKLKRALSALKGRHFKATDLMDAFEDISTNTDEWMERAVVVFADTLQTLLDVMHDVTQRSQTGGAQFVQIGLYYWLIDELIAAQSLARRNHATLAYGHLRSCMEILDKAELFGEKPEFAELWASGDEHEIWKKLSPARVREQLSREPYDPKKKSYDPLYEYLSQQGAHSTFTALRSRVTGIGKPEDGRLTISIFMGGISDPGREISILMYCVMITNFGIMKAVQVFIDRLNTEDILQMVLGVTDSTLGFFTQFFSSVDGLKIDKGPLELLLAAWIEMRESLTKDGGSS
jgi:hypothetical protein